MLGLDDGPNPNPTPNPNLNSNINPTPTTNHETMEEAIYGNRTQTESPQTESPKATLGRESGVLGSVFGIDLD